MYRCEVGLLFIILCAFFSMGAGSGTRAYAQFVMEHDGEAAVRGFHAGRPFAVSVKRSFQSDSEARAEFDRILSAVGLGYISDRIILRASGDTDNAEAGINKKGERFIFYNATFMQKLKDARQSTGRW